MAVPLSATAAPHGQRAGPAAPACAPAAASSRAYRVDDLASRHSHDSALVNSRMQSLLEEVRARTHARLPSVGVLTLVCAAQVRHAALSPPGYRCDSNSPPFGSAAALMAMSPPGFRGDSQPPPALIGGSPLGFQRGSQPASFGAAPGGSPLNYRCGSQPASFGAAPAGSPLNNRWGSQPASLGAAPGGSPLIYRCGSQPASFGAAPAGSPLNFRCGSQPASFGAAPGASPLGQRCGQPPSFGSAPSSVAVAGDLASQQLQAIQHAEAHQSLVEAVRTEDASSTPRASSCDVHPHKCVRPAIVRR